MADFAAKLDDARLRIRAAALRAGRDPEDVRIVAVSKRHPPNAVRVGLAAGLADFGENYAQELVTKADTLADDATIRWHFIGHVQRNKVRYLVGRVHLIHTVDSTALLDALSQRSEHLGVTTRILFQVNLAGEDQKSGCDEGVLPSLIRHAASLPALEPCGLMTMPPFDLNAEQVRPHFAALRRLRDRLVADPAVPTPGGLPELSMGMSGDFEVAVEEGATLVRIGTTLFGERPTG